MSQVTEHPYNRLFIAYAAGEADFYTYRVPNNPYPKGSELAKAYEEGFNDSYDNENTLPQGE